MAREGNDESQSLLGDAQQCKDVEKAEPATISRATTADERRVNESSEKASQAFARTYTRKANTPYGRMFMYNKNWTFAQCFELSVRGAIILLAFGTPLIFGFQNDKDSFFYSNELFSRGAIVMFVYTLYLSVGDTVSFALSGMQGTIGAAMAAWVMFGFYEQGYDGEDQVAWWFGAIYGSIYVVVTLTLNFSTLAQVFALSNFVWHWMTFMCPEIQKVDVDRIFGFTIYLYGFEGIMTALGGCILALAVVMLPYPILALSKACDVAEDITTCIGESWDTAIDFYCSNVRMDHRQTKLKQEMRETQDYMGYLQGYVDSCWWEAIWFPKWRRIRLMLFHLNKVTKEAFDRLMHVIVKSASREEFDQKHAQIMGQCKPSIQKVVQCAQTILNKCMESANNGGVKDEAEESELEKYIDEVRAAMTELTQTFLKSKRDLGLADHNVGESLVDEHVFAFEVCVFGRIVTELAEQFINDARARRGAEGERLEKESNEWAIVWVVKNIFNKEVIMDHEHLNFALRNSLSILLGFAIGLVGYHQTIRAQNAGIASTAAVLLSRYGGSAVTKNLNRLLGVAIGELVGELLYSLLGWCTWWGYASVMTVVFFWTFAMLFTYYHSTRLGSVACLMAAFGTQKLLKGCSSVEVNPISTYHDVINCVISISLMMIVDAFFGLGAPSKKASVVFAETWDLLIENVMEVFNSEKDTVHEMSGKVLASVGQAGALSMEAAEEARYWKTPWKEQLFDSALKCAYGVRLNLVCIIYAVADEEGRTEEDKKEAWYMKLLQADAFADIRDGMETLLQQIKVLSQIFMHEEVQPMPALSDPILKKTPAEQIKHAIQRLMEEASNDNAVLEQKDTSKFKNMEEDGPAQLCFVISCIKSLVQDMQDFKFEVLAAGPA